MSAPVLQPGLRALDVLPSVPEAHGALRVEHDGFAPHLHPGELAIFDAADREPQHGELFVFGFARRGAPSGVRKIAQAVRRRGDFSEGPGVGWWLRFEIEPGERLVDGPLRAEDFPRKALGRVVAVLDLAP